MSSVVDPVSFLISTMFKVERNVSGLDGVLSQLDGVERKISGMSGLAKGVLAGLGATVSLGGIMAAANGVVNLHKEVQNAENSIASLISSMGHVTFDKGLAVARGQMRELRKDAATGAGGLQDYVGMFNTLVTPGMQNGKDMKEIRSLGKNAITAAVAMRGNAGLGLIGFDLQQAMTQGVGERTTPMVNQALRTINVTNKAFNDMSSAKRWDTLTKAFGSFKEAAAAMGKSWDSQTATFKDTIQSVVLTSTSGLFKAWSDDLGEVNKWLASNLDTLEDMASVVNDQLVAGWAKIRGNSAGAATAGAGGAVGSAVMGAAGIAASGGGVVASAAAVVIGGIMAAFGGAMTAAVIKYDFVRGWFAKSAVMLGEAFSDLGGSFLRLMGSPWISWIGTGMSFWVNAFLWSGALFVKGFSMFVDSFAGATEVAWHLFQALTMSMNAFATGNPAMAAQGAVEFSKAMSTGLNMKTLPEAFEELVAFAKMKPDFGKKPGSSEEGAAADGFTPPPVTNINGPVNVTITPERMDDPSTVASSWDAVMDALRMNPRGANGLRLVPRST